MLPTHQIQTLKFDIEIPSISKNSDIQNRIVRVFNGQFSSMLNDVFNAYDTDENIVLESVTLELEPILIDQLEKKIVQLSREQLIVYLDDYKINLDIKKTNPGFIEEEDNRHLHPLLYYLIHGTNPWHVLAISSFAHEWKKELKNGKLVATVKSMTWHKNAVKRLVYQLNDALFKLTVEKIFPSNSAQIICNSEVLIAHLDRNDKFHNTDLIKAKYLIWETTFLYLLSDRNEEFGYSNFITLHLEQLSSNFGLQIVDFQDNPLVSEMQNINTMANDYYKIIQETHNKHSLPTIFEPLKDIKKSIQEIETWLIKPSKTQLELSLFKKWLKSPSHNKAIQLYWVEPLRENILKPIISIFSPKGAKFVFEYQKELFQQPNSALITTSLTALKRAVWSFTLDYFLNSFSSDFQSKEFVVYHTKKLSDRYGFDHLIFIQSLLSTVGSLPKSHIKYNQLLVILRVLVKERNKPILSLNNKEANHVLSLEQLKTLLDNDIFLTGQQAVAINQWLMIKNNLVIIQTNWIDSLDEIVLKQFIEILNPSETNFIVCGINVIDSIFMNSNSEVNHSLDFKKKLYSIVFNYLLSETSFFRKRTFVEFLFKSILKEFNLDYKSLIFTYNQFLVRNTYFGGDSAEFLQIFNELQHAHEKKHSIGNVILDNSLSIDDIGAYFRNKPLSTQNNSKIKSSNIKSFTFNKMQSALELLLLNNSNGWFLFIKTQSTPYQFNKALLLRMRTAVLRKIFEFEQQYSMWIALEKKIKKIVHITATPPEIATLFFMEEGIFPQWITKKEQYITTNDTLTIRQKSLLIDYDWSYKAIENWNNRISPKKKYEVLKTYTKNTDNHILLCLYDNLNQIYHQLPSTMQLSSFFNFEKSFWKVFFATYKSNKSILSIKFVNEFFDKWEREFKISLMSNEEVITILKSSTYFPEYQLRKPVVKRRRKPEDSSVINDTLRMGSGADEELRLSLDKENKVLDEQLTKWHIRNCGLILTHPFLTHLFKLLNYLDKNNKFKNGNLQDRAVHLLHFIATGSSNPDNESDLAMEKVLCGLSVQNSVSMQIRLNENEMDTANELLNVLIGRWEKLGKTSIEGLRNTFLLRNGLLEIKDNAYQLNVESSGTDVLLDFIPWNISMVQLSWIDKIIYISWR